MSSRHQQLMPREEQAARDHSDSWIPPQMRQSDFEGRQLDKGGFPSLALSWPGYPFAVGTDSSTGQLLLVAKEPLVSN